MSFIEIITESIEWTKVILLRPFKLKKWLLLYVIALLAFQMQGGCNGNFNVPADQSREAVQTEGGQAEFPLIEDKKRELQTSYDNMVRSGGRGVVVLIVSVTALLVIALFIVFPEICTWGYYLISSR